ncbi:hypothetical protein PR202_ga07099 [Eleusine coracana subsp. coracana]|uniref:Uncharacterized protein n=1 Tax=Eleusine coracana subsp. coracana TaxID=191504 RepID=A0AAV5BXT5_ELECO|nr:hypothetical protein PR202_ga07099 [Eleusine coracana subsp. coracana]
MGTMGTSCTVSSAKGSEDGSCMDYDINFKLSLGSEGTSKLHKQAYDSKRTLEKPGLDLKLSLAPSLSVVTDADLTGSTVNQDIFVQPYIMASVPTVDEGSTSLRRPSGGMVLSFLNQADKLASLKQVFPAISNQLMAVVGAVAMKDANERHVENLVAVSSMAVGRGANSRTAQRVLRGVQACALLMEVDAAANMLIATRELKEVLISAKLTVVERDAHTLIVPRVQKEAPHFAKAMGVGSVVQLKVARRVCMVGPNTVLHMEAERGVCTDFCKAHGGGKRCLWGHPGSELGSGGSPCDRLARGKKGLCVQHNPLVDDNSVHGGLSFGAFSIISNSLSHGDGPSSTETRRQSIFMHPAEAAHRVSDPVPEGRVHGGNILSMFADGMSLGKKPTNNTEASTSAPRHWKPANYTEARASSRGSWL